MNLKEKLKHFHNREVIAYLIVGVLTTIVALTVYYGLTFTVLNPKDSIQLQIANVIMWIVAVTFAYVTNRRFVFESKDKRVLREAIRFYEARLVTLAMDMGLMFLLVTVVGLDDRIVKLFVQVIVIVANYVLSKFLVFQMRG